MKDEHRADHRQLDVALTLTRIRKLQSDRRYRDQHRLFFIEGVRNFVEAVDHRFPIETLLYSEKLLTAPLARKFRHWIQTHHPAVIGASILRWREVCFCMP